MYHSIMDWHHPDYLPRRNWEAAQRTAEGADLERDVLPVIFFSTEPMSNLQEQAAAFHADLDGQILEMTVREGRFTDLGTGSVWTVDGLAEEGPLEGRRLTAVDQSFVTFWFAWAGFQPNTEIWTHIP